jgi:hypothetical protein
MKKSQKTVKPLLLIGFLFFGFTSVSFADGGFWKVTGDLVNNDNVGTGFAERSCPMENVKLRFKSRWLGGTGNGFTGPVTPFPWGRSWGESTTDRNGRFSETSYFFPNASRGRDILIEAWVLGSNFQYKWTEVTIVRQISGGTPHQQSGNIHTFDLGAVETDLFECPTVWVPGTRPDEYQPTIEAKKEDQRPVAPKIEPIPCGWAPNGKPGIDLTFASVVVRHRDNQPNSPPERITWEVVVRNNGSTKYKGTGTCKTRVRMAIYIPELEQEREYFLSLTKPIAAGAEETFTSNSGNLGEISEANSESYNILFEIDPENQIAESNEDNNEQSGVYTPTTEAFVTQ